LVTVRTATRADDAVLAELDRLTWSPAVSPGPEPPRGRPFFSGGQRVEDVLVAEDDGGRIVGYVALHRPTPLASNRHVLHVTGLAVHPAAQRRGVARTLVDAAAHEARSRGARRLTLRVLAPNTAARALYAGCGFAEEGVLRGEFLLDGAYVDDVLMALDLGGPG
jgi:ribosomal protein S18 acetylase RimI-like enzyme